MRFSKKPHRRHKERNAQNELPFGRQPGKICLLLFQFLSQDFSHRRLGQFAAELDFRRQLVDGQPRLAVIDQFLLRRLFPFLQHDEHLDVLPPLGVGDADGAGLEYFGMLVVGLIHVPRIDVEPAGDDHVFFTVHNIEISVIDVQGEQIRLGINAPRDVTIHRKEVFEEIIQENKQAASTPVDPDIIRSMKIEKKESEK